MPMTIGDSLMLLSAIASNASTARDLLANGVIRQNQQDGLAMPGHPVQPPNKAIAAQMFAQHAAVKAQLAAICHAFLQAEAGAAQAQQQPEKPDDGTIPPTAGRIGHRLNGDGH